MGIEVIFTAEAEADLETIADYIATESRVRAATFLSELRECCSELAATPHAFPVVPYYEHLGIRRRIYQSYLIFYRVSRERIEVLHVLHGKRDLDALLFPPKSR